MRCQQDLNITGIVGLGTATSPPHSSVLQASSHPTPTLSLKPLEIAVWGHGDKWCVCLRTAVHANNKSLDYRLVCIEKFLKSKAVILTLLLRWTAEKRRKVFESGQCDILSNTQAWQAADGLVCRSVSICVQTNCTVGALVAVWQSAGFAIGRLQVRISAEATSHQGLLSLQSLRGR